MRVDCRSCDWMAERVARLTVVLRRTASSAHLGAHHVCRSWDLCDQEPCVTVKRQLDAMATQRVDEEIGPNALNR